MTSRSSKPEKPSSLIRQPSIIIGLVCVGVLLFVAASALFRGVSRTPSFDPEKGRAVTLEAVARSDTPASFLNQTVRWDGIVKSIDSANRTIWVTSGAMVFSVTYDSKKTPQVDVGTRVRVMGKMVGRSRFGPVYLQGFRIERI